MPHALRLPNEIDLSKSIASLRIYDSVGMDIAEDLLASGNEVEEHLIGLKHVPQPLAVLELLSRARIAHEQYRAAMLLLTEALVDDLQAEVDREDGESTHEDIDEPGFDNAEAF